MEEGSLGGNGNRLEGAGSRAERGKECISQHGAGAQEACVE